MKEEHKGMLQPSSVHELLELIGESFFQCPIPECEENFHSERKQKKKKTKSCCTWRTANFMIIHVHIQDGNMQELHSCTNTAK